MNNTHITSELLSHHYVYADCTSVKSMVLHICLERSIDYDAFTYALLVGQENVCVYEYGSPFDDAPDTLIIKSDSTLEYADVLKLIKHKNYYVTLDGKRIVRNYSYNFDDIVSIKVESEEEANALYNKFFNIVPVYDKYKKDIEENICPCKQLLGHPFKELTFDDKTTLFVSNIRMLSRDEIHFFPNIKRVIRSDYLGLTIAKLKMWDVDTDVVMVISDNFFYENIKFFVATEYVDDVQERLRALSHKESLELQRKWKELFKED